MNTVFPPAPALSVSQWFNTPKPLELEDFRGRVVVLHFFQMLCPGCVSHGIPQSQTIHKTFSERELVVIGLHSVFEHHEAMQPVSLKAFIHENCLGFPIAVDRHADSGPIPETMVSYGIEGTPSLVVIDRSGCIRHRIFGRVDDLALGARLGQLVAEPVARPAAA